MKTFLKYTLCLILAINSVCCSSSFLIGGLTITPTIIGTDISLEITGVNSGYIGLGFGTSMTNTDMIMIYTNESGIIVANDCWSRGNQAPALDTDLGELNNVSVEGTYSSGTWSVTVTRPLAASDAYDATILTTGTQPFIVALGPTMNPANYHTSYFVQSIDFGYLNTSPSTSYPTPTPTTTNDPSNSSISYLTSFLSLICVTFQFLI